MEGDEDEEDIDDIEHEFKIEDEEQNKREHHQQQQLQNRHITEAMLYGKMSYGRGPENGDSSPPQFPPIITARSRPVSNIYILFKPYAFALML